MGISFNLATFFFVFILITLSCSGVFRLIIRFCLFGRIRLETNRVGLANVPFEAFVLFAEVLDLVEFINDRLLPWSSDFHDSTSEKANAGPYYAENRNMVSSGVDDHFNSQASPNENRQEDGVGNGKKGRSLSRKNCVKEANGHIRN